MKWSYTAEFLKPVLMRGSRGGMKRVEAAERVSGSFKMFSKKKTSDVFGVSNTILSDFYVDRGSLDQHIQLLLDRRTHIALRGE